MRERRELILPGPPPPPMPPRSSAAGEARRAGNLGSVRVGDAGRRDLGLGSFSPLLLCFFAEFWARRVPSGVHQVQTRRWVQSRAGRTQKPAWPSLCANKQKKEKR